MEKLPGLARFTDAQQNSYAKALAEIKQGKKKTHWMWFIFPQIAGLAFSEMSMRYAIRSRGEAEAYLAHPVLGERLREICRELTNLKSSDPYSVMGSPDDMKLRSSMTLFANVSGEAIFTAVLEKFFQGMPDQKTIDLLGKTE